MFWKKIALSAVLAGALAAAPFSQAEAHRHHGFPLFWPIAAAGAVLGTAAAVATAPFRAPYYGYYGAPPAAYYPPPPAYYAPPYQPGYYGNPYYAPY